MTRHTDDGLGERSVHFAPGPAQFCRLLVAALFVASALYIDLVGGAYRRATQAIAASNVALSTLSELPQYPIGLPSAAQIRPLELRLIASRPLDEHAVREILVAWRVVDRGITLEQLQQNDDAAPARLKAAAANFRAMRACTRETAANLTSIGLLLCLPAQFSGGSQPAIACADANQDLSGALIAAAVDEPGAMLRLETALAQIISRTNESFPCPRRARWFEFAWDWFPDASSASGNTRWLRSLLLATTLVRDEPAAAVAASGNSAPAWTLFTAEQRLLFEEAANRIRTGEAVRAATSQLVLWRGPEQFFLIFLAVFLLALFADRVVRRFHLQGEAKATLRFLRPALVEIFKLPVHRRRVEAKNLVDWLKVRKTVPNLEGRNLPWLVDSAERCLEKVRPNSLAIQMAEKAILRVVSAPSEPELFRHYCDSVENQVERSGWVLRYTARALPAIGFVGTVRGIMEALKNTDAIFGASGSQQAAAMAAVTEPLGLAFATTLIALIAGLITSLIGDWELAQEQYLLSRLEEALIDTIDPLDRPEPESITGYSK